MQLQQFRKRRAKLHNLGGPSSQYQTTRLGKGMNLYMEGAHAKDSFLVLTGRMRLMAKIGPGLVTVGWAGEGDIFGLEPVLSDSVDKVQYQRQFTARAAEGTVVYSYPPSCPEVAEELHFEMLRAVVQAHKSVPARLAQFILWWQEKYGNPIPYWFTHQEIADLIGSTRETVTVLLNEFKRDRIINIENNRIEIEDFSTLRINADEENQ